MHRKKRVTNHRHPLISLKGKMENYKEIVETISLTMGVSWASGINLYATLLILGLGAANEMITLPPALEVLSNPMVIGAAALMYFIEFIADKIPGVDTGWDGLHTFVRIPAGAMLAAGAIGEVAPAMEITAAILGGTMAASTHATKAGSRVLINSSPEPFSNWGASISEDLMVMGGIWAALNYPFLFIVCLVLFIILLIWLLPKLWAGVKKVFGFLGRILGFSRQEYAPKSTSLISKKSQNDDVFDQLTKLKKLLEDGVLTQDEFDEQKRKILQ